ncbi:MAG: AAA family ATPase [Myxococcota bacterium]
MLLRLEVDGFKNLSGVDVAFGPFTCIAGPNGVGKSNLFDAIAFLSLLAQHRIAEAARLVRGTEDDPTDPRELFGRRRGAEGHDFRPIRLAAEMIVPREVRDPYGRTGEPSITLLRYELELAYQPPEGAERYGRVVLSNERLAHINVGDAPTHIRWHHSKAFRKSVVTGARRGAPFISTTTDNGIRVVRTHQDGGSSGRPFPARDTSSTVVGSTNSADEPTIYAAKLEMSGWRQIALDPRAMRRPDKYWETGEIAGITSAGGHLPGTLWRLGPDPAAREAVWATITGALSELVPVERIRVVANDANQQYELELSEPGGPWMGSRALSEGTLRFLALAAISADPGAGRLLCMEEPENGIHPLRLSAMLDLLTRIAVDPMEVAGDDNPLRQVIVNTHAPGIVQLLEGADRLGDLLVAERVVMAIDGRPTATVRFRHRSGSWRSTDDDPGVARSVAIAYLTSAVGAQLPLVAHEP